MSFSYGGQALIEGVLIRGRSGVSVAVRIPDGRIVTYTERVNAGSATSLGRLPFVRGIVGLWGTLSVGTRMLMYSANVASGAIDPDESPPAAINKMLGVSIGTAVGLFFVLPMVLMQKSSRRIQNPLLASLLEGFVRLGLFMGYLAAISQTKQIQRVFAYHGAEHKTVHAQEQGKSLSPEEVQQFPTAHPRCGTAFLLQMMLLSSVAFAFFGKPSFKKRILLRVVMAPVLSSISYELLKLGATGQDNPVTRILIGPGLALQRLTTREPDDAQVEVAIAAMNGALALDAASA